MNRPRAWAWTSPIAIGLVVVSLLACPSAPQALSLDQAEEDLAALEASLDQARWEPDLGLVRRVARGAEDLLRRSVLSRDLQRRAWFLLADCQRILQDRMGLARAAETLQWLDDQHSLSLVAASWLLEDPQQALHRLETVPPRFRAHPRWEWERALLLARLGRHGEAVAAFDRALEGLPSEWTRQGRILRQESWNLRNARPDLGGLARLTRPTWAQFLEVVTPFTPNPVALVGPAGDSPLTRALLARWILHFAAERLGDPELRTRPSQRLRSRTPGRSPLPDVGWEHPALDAILFSLEHGFLDLPDGRKFQPEGVLTGSEAVAVVESVLRRFGR